MARRKDPHMRPQDYAAIPPEAPEHTAADSVAHQFILYDTGAPKQSATLSTEETERRELKRRFKQRRGFRPATNDLEELRALVARVGG